MKTVIKYVSALGREFADPWQAMADEDRLPSIIATYEHDLTRLVVGNEYGGKILTEEEVAEMVPDYQRAVADYKAKWDEVQAQRKVS